MSAIVTPSLQRASFLILLAALVVAWVVAWRRPVNVAHAPARALPGQLDINQASAETLALLPGLGPALAQRVVDYRAAHGPFPKVEALTQVSGIGPGILAKLRLYVVCVPALPAASTRPAPGGAMGVDK